MENELTESIAIADLPSFYCFMWEARGNAGGPRYSEPYTDEKAAEIARARFAATIADRILYARTVRIDREYYRTVGPYRIVTRMRRFESDLCTVK